MKQNTDNSSFSLLPDAGGYDPIEDRLRANIRATIEAITLFRISPDQRRRRFIRL